jgi:Kef-type K+ transport system membrane component KefB
MPVGDEMGEALSGYLFYEIAALLVLAASAGFIGVLLRQPLIVSFIAVGIIAGPSVLDIARSDEPIDLLAELGIAVLLFMVGLKLDLKLVRQLGPVALTTGLGQVAFTTVVGFIIAVGLGFDTTTALYVAIALTFSSTIIIVKLLSDKREIDSLHGRIALGFLIVQDIVVVIAMITLSGLGVGAEAGEDGGAILRVGAYGALMLAGVFIFIRTIATPLSHRLAKAPELLVSFAIGWAALLAAVGYYLGFGKELGGLLAGVSLASTPYREAIAARLASLRDFLLLFFFISLGASLDLTVLGAGVGPAIVFSLFVLIGNPLIVLLIMSAMGYARRTGFLAGLTVAQISEFSLIFMAMGLTLGHVTEDALGLVTLVGLITIAASTYMITYSHRLYAWAEPVLRMLPVRGGAAERTESNERQAPVDAIVFGVGRYGLAVAQSLKARGCEVLAIDFDPLAVRYAASVGVRSVYGDASDPEFVAHLPLSDVRWVICATPEHDPGLSGEDPRRVLLRTLTEIGFKGQTAVAAHTETAVGSLSALGADLTLMPYRDAAVQAADLLAEGGRPAPLEIPDPLGQKELDP